MLKKNKNVKKSSTPIPVLLKGEEIGQILKIEAKPVLGRLVANIWVEFVMGEGALDKITGVIEKEGITIGSH